MEIINTRHPIFQIGIRAQLSSMLFILIIASGLSACTGKTENSPDTGEIFPLSILSQVRNIDGRKIDFKNKTLLINFWATWCTPCRKEMPDLQKLSEALDQSQFAVIGISVDDDTNLVKEFLLHHKIRFINFQDEKLKTASRLLDIQVFPETFIVSPTGTIIKRITGEQAWDEKLFKKLLEKTDQVESKLVANRTFG
jgi:thiol-disulfide isomerase/thioredoxin